jgi:hypothetical protein
MAAFSASIPVPNGNFTSPGNAGSVGGGLIGTPVNNQPIGTPGGPWNGSTAGVLGLLLPPEMTISTTGGFGGDGIATISGIANVGILGVLDNGALFSQTLGVAYLPNTVYTLSVDVTNAGLLSLGALTNSGVGIALTSGGSVVDSSLTSPLSLVSLSLLSGNFYDMTLQFTTGAVAPSGNIGINLFDTPTNLVNANLLQTVSFSDVTLNAGAPTPEPATFGLSGLVLMGLGIAGRFAYARKQGAVAKS